MEERPGFFRTVLRTHYDADVYAEVAPGGPRAAFIYLLKLALLVAALGVIILTAYQRHQFQTVIQPQIESQVKPAFADSPALSWKDGVLTAEGTVPFSASVEVEEQRFTMVIDTRDDADTAPLHEGTGETLLLTATHLFRAVDQKVTHEEPYGKRFDGMTLAAGEAYRFRFREPPFELMSSAIQTVLLGIQLLLVLCAGSVIAAALGVALVPDSRGLGAGSIWSVAAHAMTPGATVLLGVFALLLFTVRDPSRSPQWLLWAAPLAVALLFTYRALKACTSETPRSDRQRPKASDEDLLPPEGV